MGEDQIEYKPIREIRETDLTEAEGVFIDGILELVERNLSYDGTDNIVGSIEYFSGYLRTLTEAEIGVRDALSEEMVEADADLRLAQVEFKNYVVELRRNIDRANKLNSILDIASRIVFDNQKDSSDKIIKFRSQIKEVIL